MPHLHYGSEVTITLDETAIKRVVEAVASHASRGGWVTTTDTAGAEWSFLVTVGIPIWITETE